MKRQIKKTGALVMVLLIGQLLQAQTWGEWFNQKKTQMKYLVDQITALKVYADDLQKGYAIAREGLGAINDIGHGDFLLHEGYFDSLKIVNPVIKRSVWLADIILVAGKINFTAKAQLKDAQQTSKSFTAEDLNYLSRVYANIVDACADDLDLALLLFTDGELQLTDAQRIQRLAAIDASIKDKYSFVKSFSHQAQMLFIQRTMQQSETDMVRQYYGIK